MDEFGDSGACGDSLEEITRKKKRKRKPKCGHD
jgi:hypothetical protein